MCKDCQNTVNISYSITGAGVKTCSGGCSYCSAASSMDYTLYNWTNRKDKDKIIEALRKADEQSYREFKADFPKLEEALDNDPQMKNALKQQKENNAHIYMSADIWMGDPLTSFSALQEIVDFLKDYAKRRDIELHLHTSTNGLPTLIDEYCEYLIKENIGLQLSHDGLGQWIRTQDLDPLDFDNCKALIKCGTLNWINATLNFWNNNMLDNRDYFVDKLKQIFPLVFDPHKECTPEDDKAYRGLFIKLNRVYDGNYDLKAPNKDGKFGKYYYDALKNVPLGNISFRNDKELADETGVIALAHSLDDYIDSYIKIYKDTKDPNKQLIMMPFQNYLQDQFSRNHYMKSHDDPNAGACRVFQRGLKDTTFVLDTLGRYSQCNLIDADSKVENPGGDQPKYCKGCKYEFSEECNGCGSVAFPRERCEFRYRWNQMIEIITQMKDAENQAIRDTKTSISRNFSNLIWNA